MLFYMLVVETSLYNYCISFNKGYLYIGRLLRYFLEIPVYNFFIIISKKAIMDSNKDHPVALRGILFNF